MCWQSAPTNTAAAPCNGDEDSRNLETMVRPLFLLILIPLGLILGIDSGIQAQESPDLHVVVNMVQLNVAVADKNGNYITGLRPKDFAIGEDRNLKKAAPFADGGEPALRLEQICEPESCLARS